MLARWGAATGALVAAVVALAFPAVAGPSSGALVALDLESGEQRWRVDLEDGRFLRGPSAAGDYVYATEIPCFGDDYEGPRVVAFDARTGKRRWRSDTGMRLVSGPSAGSVLAVDDGGTIRALDARTGGQRWRLRKGDQERGVSTSPALVFAAPVPSDPLDPARAAETASSEVTAFDRRTGDRSWMFTSTPDVGVAPFGMTVVAADKQVVALTQAVVTGVLGAPIIFNDLIVVDAKTGNEQFRARHDGDALALSGETSIIGSLLIYSDETGVVGRDLDSGAIRWRVDSEGYLIAASAQDQAVYLGVEVGVVALDAATGETRWEREAQPAYLGGGDDGVLITRDVFPEDETVVEALDTDDGKSRWEVRSPRGMEYSAEVAGFGHGSVFLNRVCDH